MGLEEYPPSVGEVILRRVALSLVWGHLTRMMISKLAFVGLCREMEWMQREMIWLMQRVMGERTGEMEGEPE